MVVGEGGAQVAVGGDWRLGFAAGYDESWLDNNSGASVDGNRASLGGFLKYNPGPLLLSAGVAGG